MVCAAKDNLKRLAHITTGVILIWMLMNLINGLVAFNNNNKTVFALCIVNNVFLLLIQVVVFVKYKQTDNDIMEIILWSNHAIKKPLLS